MDLEGILKPKIAGILLLAGIICLILAPIFGMLLATVTITEADPEKGYQQEISQDYTNMLLENAYKQEFTLEQGQKCIIKLSCSYENSSITLEIAGKGDYSSIQSANGTAASVAGLQLMYSEFKANYDPSSSPSSVRTLATFASISQDGAYYIEFMGTGDANGIWSKPGDYVLVVYGENTYFSTDPETNKIKFDIQVMLEGPGDILEDTFSLIGWILILVSCCIGVIYILKNAKPGGA